MSKPTFTENEANTFSRWLMEQVIQEARGDRLDTLSVDPDGRFWLGRLCCVERIKQMMQSHHSKIDTLDDDESKPKTNNRWERMEPCALGIRVRPTSLDGRSITTRVRFVVWKSNSDEGTKRVTWTKTKGIEIVSTFSTPRSIGESSNGSENDVRASMNALAIPELVGKVQAEVERGKDGPQLLISFINTSPLKLSGYDTNFYEVELEVDVGDTQPFLLDSIEDSFRYERRVSAYGVNCAVRSLENGRFVTSDFGYRERKRPSYWDEELLGTPIELSFETLMDQPLPILERFVQYFEQWTKTMWSTDSLKERMQEESWTSDMFLEAQSSAREAHEEVARLRYGLKSLRDDANLLRSFQLANRSFHESRTISHTGWRSFQLGYLIANAASIAMATRASEADTVDTLWFATGGGKTETYLLFTVTAAFYDRLTGKQEGITSWGRFPLRMLSMQQSQRFADVFAAAELVRMKESIGGDIFSVGYFMGEGNTPNRIKRKQDQQGLEERFDYENPTFLAKFQILLRCPFCGHKELQMEFDKTRWALDHVCKAKTCPWKGRPLPFRIVDEEIYRWLPTMVLGTLDKAALMAIQASAAGFYRAPYGKCPQMHHGFTYAKRSTKPQGCLFPGCTTQKENLAQPKDRYAPTIRMQDELHLLRDSIGSIDAHYEALLDHLQKQHGNRPKIIASSATLAGHERQIKVLYRRDGRVFPLQGPKAGLSFWSQESDHISRRYVGFAPRGVSLEYAHDQLVTTLQTIVRHALNEPRTLAHDIGIDPDHIGDLVSYYGVDVVYGSTLKDVEAASRSFTSQIQVAGPLNSVTLSGRTPPDEVRSALERLTTPEVAFNERIHLIAASSMLSHGVDIDRLNVMVMLGLPLSSSQFIQTTARVGRTHPGLVFTLHKMPRERDAAVFHVFDSFIEHIDRLIDPVPITARSRQVLELTFSGLEQGRILGVHEPRVGKPLTTRDKLKEGFASLGIRKEAEVDAIIEMLGWDSHLDEHLKSDLIEMMDVFFQAKDNAGSTAKFISDLFPHPTMRSLRDVEKQVPIYDRGGNS